jgi:hypothetical protein
MAIESSKLEKKTYLFFAVSIKYYVIIGKYIKINFVE